MCCSIKRLNLSLITFRPNNKIMSVRASLNLSRSIATVVKLGYCKSLRPFWLRTSQGCGGRRGVQSRDTKGQRPMIRRQAGLEDRFDS